jgi:pyruvate/2-oxoglutarate dehydrogenase complex dihydrolipoamide dehydrogenase (E3) component
MAETTFDVVVIGSGPGGYMTAIHTLQSVMTMVGGEVVYAGAGFEAAKQTGGLR